jgi:hypothetical protein
MEIRFAGRDNEDQPDNAVRRALATILAQTAALSLGWLLIG